MSRPTFKAQCPKGDTFAQNFTAEELKVTPPPLFYCGICDTHWEPTPEQIKSGLASIQAQQPKHSH